MQRQLTTSLSDAVLSYVSFHAAYRTMPHSMSAAIGFFIIGAAAFIGAIRFAVNDPPTDLVSFHKFLSWLGSAVAMPYIAAGYHRQVDSMLPSNLHMASGFGLLIAQNMLASNVKDAATEAISTCSVISILLVSVLYEKRPGVLGAVCYAIAGLVVKTDGTWFGVPRVDLFHYVLVIANILLMMGLQKAPQPVYYTPPIRS